MPNLKTSEEAAAGPLTGDELVRGVQDGGDVRMTTGDIAALGGGSVAAAVAAVAKTLRRMIDASRNEPNSELRTLTYSVFEAARIHNTDGNLTVWQPDGANFYNSVWTADQAMMIEAYLEYFAPAEVSAIATYWLSKCDLTQWWVPDDITSTGTVNWKPGPARDWGSRAPADGAVWVMQMFWLHYVMTGAPTLYEANSAALKGLLENMPFNPTTGCVTIDDSAPFVGFVYFDSWTLSGDVLFPSILAVRGFWMAAEMEFALGNTAEAARLLARAETIKAGINSTLVVRQSGSGGELAAPYSMRELAWGMVATIKGGTQIDLWSSCYLVWCDIVSPSDARAISNFLNYVVSSTGSDNYYRGGLRNVLKTSDYSPGALVFSTSWSAEPVYGQQQNGALWGMPVGWLQYALSLVQPEQARQVALDLYWNARGQATPMWEWFNPAGNTGSHVYVNSTSVLMYSAFSDGPALITDEWSGVIRAVTNETIKLVLNAKFPGIILDTTTICASGSATATFQINGVALGGTPNPVTTTQSVEVQTSANRFNKGDEIEIAVSANAACVDLYFAISYIRPA